MSAQLPSDNTMFLSDGLASNVPGVKDSAPDDFGMLATVWDTADGYSSSGQRQNVDCNVTRFRSPGYAGSAIAKAKAGNGTIVWQSPKTVPMAWAGVPGATGTHYLYNVGWVVDDGGPVHRDTYLAIQVIGPFIVSADSWDKGYATQAVTDMVANLRTAKLVS